MNSQFSNLADLVARARDTKGDGPLFEWFAGLATEFGRADLAEEFLLRAAGPIRSKPASLEAGQYYREGCDRVERGKLDEAETSFREAIRLDPSVPGALGQLGNVLARLGRGTEAEAAWRLAVRIAPADVNSYVNLAGYLLDQKRPTEAEEWVRQAIQLDPDQVGAHRLLGCALQALGRPGPAEAALRAAVARRPDASPLWADLGHFLEGQGRVAEAVDCAREAARREPALAGWHNNLGAALASAGQTGEALAAYREALRLDPGLSAVHGNLGLLLRAEGRQDEAEACLRHALRLEPRSPDAHNGLGAILAEQEQTDEAMQHYEEALRLDPQHVAAHVNRAQVLLAAGDYARGFPEYEWRLKTRQAKPPVVTAPQWDGRPLEGQSILLSAEQGLGDTLQFIRYAPLVQVRGGNVVLDCPPNLASLAATCPGLNAVVARGSALPRIGFQVPLLSLPGVFGVPPDIPTASVPYLRPEADRVAYWQREVAGMVGVRVGIAWQGNRSHPGDRQRSVELARFAPLASIPGIVLCSLQKGAGAEQLESARSAGMPLCDLGARTGPDMADVAALLMSLDLVVTIDSALAHLAGALGRPVWALLPRMADWRWGRQGEFTHWYPTMRLFRQTTRGDWDEVFGRVAAALAEVAGTMPRTRAEG